MRFQQAWQRWRAHDADDAGGSVFADARVQRAVTAAVVILAVFAAANQIRFSLSEPTPRGRDWDYHLLNSFKIYHCHFQYGTIIQWYKNAGYDSSRWPPLAYLASALAMELAPERPLGAIQASRAVFILILVLSVYGAGRRFGGGPWPGLAAAVLAGLNPLALVVEAPEVNLDFPAMVMIALVIYVYSRTIGFSRWPWSVGLGVACGLAMLTKTVSAVFLAPFLALAFVFPERNAPSVRLRLQRLALVVAVALAMWLPFYLPLWRNVLAEYRGEAVGDWSRFFPTLLEYGKILTSAPLVFFVAFGLPAAVVCVVRRDRPVWPLVGTWIIGVLFFAKIRFITPHYILPIQVLSPLLLTRWMMTWRASRQAALALVLTALLAIPALVMKAPVHPSGVDAKTVAHLQRLTGLFRDRYVDIEVRDIGYLTYNNMATDALRRGLLGASLALARPDQVTGRTFDKTGDHVARFCAEAVTPDKLAFIAEKSLVVAILPMTAAPNEPCDAELFAAVAAISPAHRLDEQFSYSFPTVSPGDEAKGFGRTYAVKIYRRNGDPATD
jgi:hypothetical protein